MERRMISARVRRSVLGGVVVCGAALASACSPAGDDSKVSGVGNPAAGPGGGGASATGGAGSLPGTGNKGPNLGNVGDSPMEVCQGLECAVPTNCAPGTTTSISGKVFAPNGTLPLYNVVVYVPNPEISPVPAFTAGASCDRCGASVVNPVTSAITDETGSFKLEGAPAAANVPLVMQVGKWRRQITIPAVTGCMDNPLTDPQLTRLPRNKTEGDLPQIAIAAGGADQMECLPLRLGIDPAEFTSGTGTGRVHLYSGQNEGQNRPVLSIDAALPGAGPLSAASTLWATKESLMKYDIAILSCEGGSFDQTKPVASRQALYDYASSGGRVFASHWHNIWFAEGPPLVQSTGTWRNRPNPAGDTGNAVVATINQTFPKGAALAQWLVNVSASATLGQMDVYYPRDNIQAVNTAVAREWITVNNPMADGPPPSAVQYMSFNTPIGVPEEQVCGREVYTNLHVAAVDSSPDRSQVFPVACEMKELSAQEKAVAFMLFDLSSCVMNDDKEPEPPH